MTHRNINVIRSCHYVIISSILFISYTYPSRSSTSLSAIHEGVPCDVMANVLNYEWVRTPLTALRSLSELKTLLIPLLPQQLCEDTGCSPEDLPEAMNDREKWRERVRDIRASGTTWWWWLFFYIVWFGLVPLFNGISNFLGHLMPKPPFSKNSRGTI